MKLGAKYMVMGGVLAAFFAALVAVVKFAPVTNRGATSLIQPIVAGMASNLLMYWGGYLTAVTT